MPSGLTLFALVARDPIEEIEHCRLVKLPGDLQEHRLSVYICLAAPRTYPRRQSGDGHQFGYGRPTLTYLLCDLVLRVAEFLSKRREAVCFLPNCQIFSL